MARKIIKIISIIILILIVIVILILGIQKSDFSKIKKYDKKDSSPTQEALSPLKRKTANQQRHDRRVKIQSDNMANLGDFHLNIAGGKTLIANISLKYKSTNKSNEWFSTDETIQNEIVKKSVLLRDAVINTMLGNNRATINSQKIRRELKKSLNKNLSSGQIEEVYFNKFLIQ